MNEMWQKIKDLIAKVTAHPDTRQFAGELRAFVIEKLIAWLEGVLKGRPGSSLAAV